MELTLTSAQRSFRDEVRAWLAANAPRPPLPAPGTDEGFAAHRAWERELFAAGYAALRWPRSSVAAAPTRSRRRSSRRSTSSPTRRSVSRWSVTTSWVPRSWSTVMRARSGAGCRGSWRPRTSGSRGTPSRRRAATSQRSAPGRSGTATGSWSTGRRSGPPGGRTATGSSPSSAPIPRPLQDRGDRPEAGGSQLPGDRPAVAGCRGPADHRPRRSPGVRRGVLHRRPRAG